MGSLEKSGERRLRAVEAGGEAQRLLDGRAGSREGFRAGGAALELGGDAQGRGFGRGDSSPVTSRYQRG